MNYQNMTMIVLNSNNVEVIVWNHKLLKSLGVYIEKNSCNWIWRFNRFHSSKGSFLISVSVTGIDNNMRQNFFGPEASIQENLNCIIKGGEKL